MKTETREYILLKWGTLKGWNFVGNEKLCHLMEEYVSIGSSYSAMAQVDTPRQKEIICLMIDECHGDIQNDWTGEIYANKESAKKYVLEYNSK